MAKYPKNPYTEDFRCASPCDALLAKYKPTEAYFIQIKCHQRDCKEIKQVGNHRPDSLVDFRCLAIDPKKSERAGEDVVCNKLLARISAGTEVQVRCPRCGSFEASTPNG